MLYMTLGFVIFYRIREPSPKELEDSKKKWEDFKQKTAYEIRLSLVGSEMCIRDSTLTTFLRGFLVVLILSFPPQIGQIDSPLIL